MPVGDPVSVRFLPTEGRRLSNDVFMEPCGRDFKAKPLQVLKD